MNNEFLRAQQEYVPEIDGVVAPASIVVVGGMGGSAHAGEALRFLESSPHVVVHRDYGLPQSVPEGAQYIAISYSGNTEETLSFAHAALDQGHPLSVVSGGGALAALAQERGLAHVRVPEGLVPRDALLYMVKALCALLGEEHLVEDASFDVAAAEAQGEELARTLTDAVPLFYASNRNGLLALLGAIYMNETAKRPAFANVIPESNHNAMQGFATPSEVPYVSVFLRDASDNERIMHRMDRTEDVLGAAGMQTERLLLPGVRRLETLMYAWWMIRTAAQHLAKKAGLDPNATPLIEEFKRTL